LEAYQFRSQKESKPTANVLFASLSSTVVLNCKLKDKAFDLSLSA